MKDYDLNGIYFFEGREYKYFGKLLINENGQISGEIKDSASRCPRHEIKGNIIQLEDEVVLEFLKNPTGDFVEYLSGTYEGAWRFPNPKSLHKIGIGYDPEMGDVAIWIPREEIGNKTHLTLTERL